MDTKFPSRKTIRLQNYDYNSGIFFLTICTKDRACILSTIVGTGVPDGPKTLLTEYGMTAQKYILQMNDFYDHISIDKYVIMPNHIHLIIRIHPQNDAVSETASSACNTILSQFISAFKRFCNKDYGKNIWQSRSYDHVIRNKNDYDTIFRYIHKNPIRCHYDQLYSEK